MANQLSGSSEPLHILGLTVENFKRIEVVHVEPDPDGELVIVSGKNGSGKTSLIDAIESGLGGKDAFPPVPVKVGAKESKIEIDLGELKIRRRIVAKDGKTTATFDLINKEGALVKSPQAALESLYNKLAVDPLRFSRMDPKEQRKVVAQLSGVDPDQFQGRRQAVFNERTVVNRDVARTEQASSAAKDDLRKKLAAIGAKSAPDKPVDVALIMAELHAANKKNSERSNVASAVRDAERDLVQAKRQHDQAVSRVAELQAELAKAEKKVVEAAANLQSNEEELGRAKAELEAIPVVDVRPIEEQASKAGAHNEAYKAGLAVAKAAVEHAAAKKKSDELTDQIEQIDAEYKTALSNAKMPIDGLSFNDHGVTYNGVPFEQASAAEQLRISCAIAMSQEHRIRVIAVRDGSLLDSESWAALTEIAKERKYQVWAEIVADKGETGIRLVDGRIQE